MNDMRGRRRYHLVIRVEKTGTDESGRREIVVRTVGRVRLGAWETGPVWTDVDSRLALLGYRRAARMFQRTPASATFYISVHKDGKGRFGNLYSYPVVEEVKL
tara:strand:+ start:9621 stop:9929 length:309 start_codon:yes stop_codon:yes gene_type:complete